MSARLPIRIEALVDPAEQPGMFAAAEQLSGCLKTAAGGQAWPVQLKFGPHGGQIGNSSVPAAVIVSLLPEVGHVAVPFAQTEARWRAYLVRLQSSGAPVFVCTVFRHVPDRAKDGAVSPLLEHIRRLNRLAVDLSHDLGVAVIDIDRAFAHLGGSNLKTDYRLSGVVPAEVVGHTVVWSLLSFGLDEVIDPELQEKAKTALGDLRQIDVLVGQRMKQRRAVLAADKKTARG